MRPLGQDRTVSVDVRVVSATNRDLRREVTNGKFREDLYYRLAGVEITVPPLRERMTDVPAISRRLLSRALPGEQRELAPEALRALMRHSWPGNVRELENVLTKAAVLCEGETIHARDVEIEANRVAPTAHASRTEYAQDELDRMRAALQRNRFSVAKAARELGIPRATFYRKMAKLEPSPR